MSAEPKRGRGRPSLGPRKRISLNLPAALVDLLEADARRRSLSVTDWLRRATLRYLESDRQPVDEDPE